MEDLRKQTKEICDLFKISPSRSKGQNFLVNEKIYDDIVSSADISDKDEVLEVGPGLGFLTTKLAKPAKRVVAVELDKLLYAYLKDGITLSGNEKISVINEDILRFKVSDYVEKGYKIVANLPYNISSIFLRSFLPLYEYAPTLMVLMLQLEVAQRIIAKPGEMSLLAVSVQHYADAKIERVVKAGNFWPKPEVDSAVIKLVLKEKKYDKEDDKLFFRLLKVAFSAKRKMIKNNLAGGLRISPDKISQAMEKAKIKESARAQDLSLQDWYDLFASIREFML